MLVEGVGMKAPAPVPIWLPPSVIARLERAAAERDRFRNYSRGDTWARGFVHNPIFVGMCGEHAVCEFVNKRCRLSLEVDTALRLKGDGGTDLAIYGMRIQVKTRKSGTTNLVRRVDGKKHIKTLDCDAFVFARLNLPTVDLLGWITADDARRVAKHERSTRGDHFNLCVSDSDLLPMARLIEEIESRRDA